MSEFYYGLPQPVWDNLCSEAEDLLYENKIGQHILGLYPAGDRIFGKESSSPGLFVLYMDSVDSLIDPFHLYKNKASVQRFLVGNSMSPIYFVDAFMWVHYNYFMATEAEASIWCHFRYNFTHMIPFGKHMIYEDPSFSAIVGSTAEFSIKGSYYPEYNLYSPPHDRLLFNRTEAIIAEKQVFSPCTNPDWDEVITLEGEEGLSEEELNKFYIKIIQKHKVPKGFKEKEASETRKMLMDLYRFQL